MARGTKSGRQARSRGSVGAGKGRRHEKPSQLYLPTPVTRDGKKIIATIYFATDEHTLREDDRFVLSKVVLLCLQRLLKAEDVRLRIEGHADVRYYEDYNLKLSSDRAWMVEQFLRTVSVKGSLPLEDFRAFRSNTVAHGEESAGRDWAEDRRVDVVDVSPLPPKGKKGFFYYMLNQNVFRALYFKHYYPRYWLWRQRGLEYLVDLYEKEGASPGAFLKVRPSDYDKLMEVIEQVADYDNFQKIESDYLSGKRQEVAEAYEVEYRKAWREAKARAEEDFEASDFRHPWEFFAVKFGLVPKDTPYHKRQKGGRDDDYRGTPTYYKDVTGH
jgi:outer membrane protein OmpA-like peptidoglycan-associated protein